MNKITVLLESGTVGSFAGDSEYNYVGSLHLVSLGDENGLPIQEIGVVAEILEIEEY